MKLAAKLVVVLVLGLIAAIAIEGSVFVQREETLFRREMQQDVLLIGDAIKGPLAETWREKGEGRALQMIADANEGEHIANIRWVWFADAVHPDRTPQLSATESRDVVGGSRQFFERRDQKGNPQLVGYLPVAPSGPAEGALEVSKPLSHLDARLDRSILRIVVMSGTIVVGGGLAIVLLGTRWVGVPLSQVMSKLRRVGEGDLTGPLELRRRDELGELAGAINAMCTQLADDRERIRQETAARIDALERLRHADRLSTVGKLAAGVAHELGAPLNVVAARAKLIAGEAHANGDSRANAAVIRQQTERMANIVRQLLTFSRRDPPQSVPVDLFKVARRTIEFLDEIARSRNVTLRLTGGEGSWVATADAGQMQQVLTNLTLNAIQAMPHGGEVNVAFHRCRARREGKPDAPEFDCIRIDVVDEGQGIAPEIVGRIFEPFFTTKDVGEGTGMGLSIAYGIVSDHGGWFDVKSKPGLGSRFSVFLPANK